MIEERCRETQRLHKVLEDAGATCEAAVSLLVTIPGVARRIAQVIR